MKFIYGSIPELHPFEELVLVCSKTAEAFRHASESKTWGAYAAACGIDWEQFVEDWGEEVCELTDSKQAHPDAAFDFSEVYGAYYVGSAISDPREAAYIQLVEKNKKTQSIIFDAEGDGHISAGGSSPGGGMDVITADDEEGFLFLESAFRKAKLSISLTRDDELIAQTYAALFAPSGPEDE